MAKLYPLPIEAVATHPVLMRCPCAVYGQVMRIAIHYAMTRCAPLPRSDHELAHIARAHLPTWRAWKGDILSVLEDILPPIAEYYDLRDRKAAGLLIGPANYNAKRRLERLQTRLAARPTLADYAITPQKEPTPPRPPNPDQRGVQKLWSDAA